MNAATILIADDDSGIRTVLSQALTRIGHSVKTGATASSLWESVSAGEGDLVVTDIVMPDENGLDLIPRIRHARPDLPIIVMSAHSTLTTAVKATERGAFDYLAKPFDLNDLLRAVDRALSGRREGGVVHPPESERQSERLPERLDDEALPLVGRSAAMQEVYRLLARLMGADLTVTINGESGTGKELVARALHDYGKRRAGPFVPINMAAIPRDLIESELFGHEKGAFTGALARKDGRFRQAEGGTLFLDEIGDMPPEAQTRLLRVLQEGEYTRIGGQNPIKADARIVAATHRDLKQLIRQGLFREDLYYRLNVVPIRLPALRERSEDIPELAHCFLRRAGRDGLGEKRLSAAAAERLRRHNWPGNVRELENFCRRLSVLHPQDTIGVDIVASELTESAASGSDGAQAAQSESLSSAIERHLAQFFEAHAEGLPSAGLYDRVLKELERPLIRLSLAATNGNQIKAAQMLGLNRNTLRKKIRALDIPIIRSVK